MLLLLPPTKFALVTPTRSPPVLPPVPPPADTNVVMLGEAVVPAVRRWVRNHTESDPEGFKTSADAWEDYKSNGGPELVENDFYTALKPGRRRPVHAQDGVRAGYKGLRIKASRSVAEATT